MKKVLIFYGFFLIWGTVVAQPGGTIEPATLPLDSLLNSEMRINMAIPSNPAYQIIGSEPSNLLRVSNPKEFSVAVSNFFSDGFVIVPQNIGVEFSPVMILENGGLISDTNKVKCLKPLRLSLGTAAATSDTLGGNGTFEDIGIGLRYTYTKPGSSFQGYKNKLRNALQPLTNDYESRVDSLRKVYYSNLGVNISQLMATLTADSLQQFFAARNLWTDSIYNTLPSKVSAGGFDATVASVKQKFKREAWNDFQVDLAAAIELRSPDTIARLSVDSFMVADSVTRLQKFGVWGTVSFPLLGVNWLQGVTGTNYSLARQTVQEDFKWIFTANARLYIGSNRLKAFLEGQYQDNQMTGISSYLWTLGAELNVTDGIWMNFYAGLNQDIGAKRNRVITHFTLHFTLPERFHLN